MVLFRKTTLTAYKVVWVHETPLCTGCVFIVRQTKKTILYDTSKTTSSVPTKKHEEIYSDLCDRIILHVPQAKQNNFIRNDNDNA